MEEGDAGGEAVEERAAADRADLAGAEHPGAAAAGDLGHQLRVVVGPTEEVRAPAVAGEQRDRERRHGWIPRASV